MIKKYEPSKIEAKWQKFWEKNKSFAATDKHGKPKFYCLVEFPYPSGEGLHVGHPRSYTALDILARKRRMEGYNVLYPIGFDAFGLPSENYAIKTGIHPAVTTAKNIATFTKQLKSLGFSFDWDRAVTTTDPEYYRWTQWIFLQMHKAGLAYKAKMTINWCPSCKIGLANEEVIDGKCERCGTGVEKKEKEQWMLKITKYADRLIKDLDEVDYLDKIKIQQINWIGRSEGANITFKLVDVAGQEDDRHTVDVFTTRPDTIFGATFLAIAPEVAHQWLTVGWQAEEDVKKFITSLLKDRAKHSFKEDPEKRGIFSGLNAINPATGQKIPVWIVNYVLGDVGTGAIMAVPAHDERDWEFAKKFKLPIIEVVSGGNIEAGAMVDKLNGSLVNSGEFNGLTPAEGIKKITAWLEKKNVGKQAVTYKIRDWVFSRQRYWGEPIPMVYCQNCKTTGSSETGWVAVPEKDLPVELPKVEKYEPTDSGESPLAAISSWVNVKCPVCNAPAQRETDTMPNWAGSNWYFLRYIDPHNNKHFADAKKMEYWLPIDWYNGGMEHTTLHLLYSRFVYKFLFDIGAVPQDKGPEPYAKRTSHGLILGEGGEKMSKSRGNVVNPDDVVKAQGADTLRLYEMFMGPFDQSIPWDTQGVIGVRRFIEKVWGIYNGKVKIEKQCSDELITLAHQTIKKVSNDIESQDYNTAVSSLMILANKISDETIMTKFVAESFLKMLAVFAPHVGEELWQTLGNKKSIMIAAWPNFDEGRLLNKNIKLVVQINGKVRDIIDADVDITEQEAEKLARQSEKVAKFIEGKKIVNIIFVPGKLINLVI